MSETEGLQDIKDEEDFAGNTRISIKAKASVSSAEALSSVGPKLQRGHVRNRCGGCESIMRTTNAILVVILSADTSATKDHEWNPQKC